MKILKKHSEALMIIMIYARKAVPVPIPKLPHMLELLLDMYERTNDQRYLENAKLAGEWIGHM